MEIKTNKKISIIIPCYNEEQVLFETCKRIKEICLKYFKVFEIILVDDGSQDSTNQKIQLLEKKNSEIVGVQLSRNFGHQAAVSAGLSVCTGDAAVIIDADLQDPPKVIPILVEKWLTDKCDVVYAVRTKRKGESFFKLFTAKIFYWVLNIFSEFRIPKDTGDFRLIDRKIIDILNSLNEKNKFLRGLISWIGFRQCPIFYERDKRYSGETKYPLFKMIKFAFDGIVSFSVKPLKLSFLLGLFITFISFIGILVAIGLRLMTNEWIEGWTALFVAILFLGGIQLFSICLLGEYICRIYYEV